MYGSLHAVPYLTSYAQALDRFKNTRPIRGSDPVRWPLGSRKDKHLSIAQTADGSIQCILYETPVVTFKPNDDVVVTPGKWTTMFTCQFINAVLFKVYGRHARGKMVLDVGGNEYVLMEESSLVLRKKYELSTMCPWEVVAAEESRTLRINKAEATKVRKQYAQFLKFYKGFVKLNTSGANGADDDELFVAKNNMNVGAELIEEVIGTAEVTVNDPTYDRTTHKWIHKQREVRMVDFEKWKSLLHKPTWAKRYGPHTDVPQTELRIQQWEQGRADLLALMGSDKTEDHLKAAIISFLVEGEFSPYQLHNSGAKALRMAVSKAQNAGLQMLYKLHAPNVLEYVSVPVGTVPTTAYDKWLFADELEAKIREGATR